MKTKHIERNHPEQSFAPTKADLNGENQCVLEWIDCVEKEDGMLICKTIRNNCLDEALHTISAK